MNQRNNKGKGKILIIEDDKFIGEIYVTKLAAEGFDVSLAEDGEEGLEMIKSEMPDVVLLDVLMPKMDGLEVLEEMKKIPELDTIKVIMLTNANEEEFVKRANAARKVEYLLKSGHTPGEVVEKIEDLLKEKNK
ncbi:MAG TPA: response regulator [Candidatus Moranbacteria bacterium]|nr:response regulator [Candidatus Moranbacteria bacterium]